MKKGLMTTAKTIDQTLNLNGVLKEVTSIFAGAFFIAFLAQLKIPLQPVPVTMQTFAVFFLGLIQGGKRAACSTLAYLALTSIGAPILSGGSANALWMLSPAGGFLLAFPFAAYVCGKISEIKSESHPLWMLYGLVLAQLVVFSGGACWLAYLFGWQEAIQWGVAPFVFFDAVKLLGAFLAGMAIRKFNF